MLKERQELILKLITEIFVKTGKPASSQLIVNLKDINCSSATVRQEMTVLEQLGFLEQPHTSGGRKPTTQGIQYYVDKLMNDTTVSLDDKLNDLFEERNQNIEYVLDKASKIIADITNLATVVISPDDKNEVLQKIQFNQLSDSSAVAIIITSKGKVYNKVFAINEAQSASDLEKLFLILNERLINTPINEIEDRLKAIGVVIAKQIQGLESVFQNFVYEMISLTKKSEFNHGTSNIVQYEDVDKETMAKLIKIINNHSTFDQFIKEQDKEILIGEHGTSVIKHQYKIKGSQGSFALIGPTRMEYEKINALISKVVEKIEDIYK